MKNACDMTLRELTDHYNATKDRSGNDIRIVIGQRGWVWVGRYKRDGDRVTVTNAQTIRKWGTTKGLGELVSGPTTKTVLDPSGTVHLHALAVLATMDCDAAAWDKVL